MLITGCAMDPAILGYGDDRAGGVFALSTERGLIVADHFAKMVPAAALVRISSFGTEAVMGALRLARADTGWESYLPVEGGYHGLFDAAMWQADLEGWDAGSNRDPDVVPCGKVVRQTAKKLAHLLTMNDMQRLQDTFAAHGDQFAAMRIEPIQGNCCGIMARVEYVHLARRLCEQYGVQGTRGVKPDITLSPKRCERVSHCGDRRARGCDADLPLWRGQPWRHLSRAFGVAGGGGGVLADTGRATGF